jgi:hypothetical protein
MASDTCRITKIVIDAVEKNDELELLTKPDAAIIPIVTKKGSSVNIYQVYIHIHHPSIHIAYSHGADIYIIHLIHNVSFFHLNYIIIIN